MDKAEKLIRDLDSLTHDLYNDWRDPTARPRLSIDQRKGLRESLEATQRGIQRLLAQLA